MPTGKPDRFTAIYCRVSTTRQDHASQLPDLKRWETAHADEEPIVWFEDKASGKNLKRPAWQSLWSDLLVGKVGRIVVWRLDRLGRSVSDASGLFDEFERRRIGFVSLKEGMDLSTPAGRMMANVVVSFAQYEREIITDRIKAGIAAAKAAGKHHGRPLGKKTDPARLKVTAERQAHIARMLAAGDGPSTIARVTGLSRMTIYRIKAEMVG